MHRAILQHFQKHDQRLFPFVKQYAKELTLGKSSPSEFFFRLCREIAYQQLAGKAAHAIFSRYEALFPDRKLTPERTVTLTHEAMRATGLSNAKARYIRNIAEGVISGSLQLHKLPNMENEAVIEHLIQIKGIGRWTAEMFLMFNLGREDVFSYGDLGLKNAIKKLYKLRKEPTRERIEQIVKKWSPYRTYASLALWRSLDNR